MRWILSCVFLFCSSVGWCQENFSFQTVIDHAKQLAEKQFQEQKDDTPDFLKHLSYDQWRDIRFRPAQTLWGKDSADFKIRFFHVGFLYNKPVIFHYVDALGVHPFSFSPELFDYGKNTFGDKVPQDLGFAGLRIHYPINVPTYEDEVAVFLGASYFRAVARKELYGLSARALCLNTAAASGEEFPFFKEFWIMKPHAGAHEITLYALLDSQSLSGAYKFIIQPGEETIIQVKSVLFIRKKIEKLGIAPMTTMFWYGENSDWKIRDNDFRPEVHDSDGLLILSKTGEWIWRPLVNPKQLSINTFEVNTPRGFGLLQRDVNFDHYQDLEARYDLRPSLWISPVGDWGAGHVELVQIPIPNEFNENINVFWVPKNAVEPGQRLNFSYTMRWCSSKTKHFYKGYVTDTRIVREPQNKKVKFILDFEGDGINKISSEKQLDDEIEVSKGYSVVEQQLIKNPVTQGWRLVFQLKQQEDVPFEDIMPGKRVPAELRVFIKKENHPETETWSYTF